MLLMAFLTFSLFHIMAYVVFFVITFLLKKQPRTVPEPSLNVLTVSFQTVAR